MTLFSESKIMADTVQHQDKIVLNHSLKKCGLMPFIS